MVKEATAQREQVEARMAALEKEKKSVSIEKSSLEQDMKNKNGEIEAISKKMEEQKALMEKALRENDDLKTTRKNYEAQVNQMTEEFVRMNEMITKLEDELAEAKRNVGVPKEEAAPAKEEKKKMNVAGSLMSGFNKLKKMTTKEKEPEGEDMFGGMTATPTANDDLFGGMTSAPAGDDLFSGMSSAPAMEEPVATEPAVPAAPAEEDFLNLNEVTTSNEEKKSRWTMPFGKKTAGKEEKKKGGFGLGSLMKNALGGKNSGTFPATEVGEKEERDV